MKNLFMLIVAGAVFLHFYPQPELQSWFEQQKKQAIETFSDVTDTGVQLKSDKIYIDLESQFAQFSADEQAYLKKMTENRRSVKAFYLEYCNPPKSSPNFHSENQKKVCQTIQQYSSLL